MDAGSPWAAEARQRLSALPVTTTDAQFRRELPRLEQSALDGDTAAVASLVGRFPQQSRAYAEAETLGRWGAAHSNDEDDAARLLTIAQRVGDALVPIAGESLLHDAVAAIDGADPSRRALLAEAHQVYRRGRIAFSRRELSSAEPDLRLAASRFEAAGSPMALAARYYAASVAYERNESGRATAELESLLAALEPHPRFASLGAHVRWELALCRIHEADWEDALALLEASAATFHRLGERGNLASIESIQATTLVSLGRPDDAWAARLRAFAALSAAGAGERLAVSIGGAARMAMRAGRADAATSLLRLEEESVRGNDVLLANVLVREATLDAARGGDAALTHATNAVAAANRITDPALRTRAENDARFATAAAVLPRDPRRAKELLDAAIAGYEERQMPAFLPESYLLRARASLRLGANGDAARDLESGIAVIERHPVQLGETVSGTGVLDAGTALFEEAILLALERGDVRNAFAYAERAHGAKADAASAETVTAPGAINLKGKFQTLDIKSIDLTPLGAPWKWSETKDHAKWGIGVEQEWVCVGDINRMISQEKRGGGAMAFQEQGLWAALAKTDSVNPGGPKKTAARPPALPATTSMSKVTARGKHVVTKTAVAQKVAGPRIPIKKSVATKGAVTKVAVKSAATKPTAKAGAGVKSTRR